MPLLYTCILNFPTIHHLLFINHTTPHHTTSPHHLPSSLQPTPHPPTHQLIPTSLPTHPPKSTNSNPKPQTQSTIFHNSILAPTTLTHTSIRDRVSGTSRDGCKSRIPRSLLRRSIEGNEIENENERDISNYQTHTYSHTPTHSIHNIPPTNQSFPLSFFPSFLLSFFLTKDEEENEQNPRPTVIHIQNSIHPSIHPPPPTTNQYQHYSEFPIQRSTRIRSDGMNIYIYIYMIHLS